MDDYKRLPLAVYAPPAISEFPQMTKFECCILDLLFLSPLLKCPFRRPMDAGIGVVSVEVEELGCQRLPFGGRQTLRPVRPQHKINARRIEVSGWNRTASIDCRPSTGSVWTQPGGG